MSELRDQGDEEAPQSLWEVVSEGGESQELMELWMPA